MLYALVLVSAETHLSAIPDNDAAEYDDFIPFGANPVKDEFDWRLLQVNTLSDPCALPLIFFFYYSRNLRQQRDTTT